MPTQATTDTMQMTILKNNIGRGEGLCNTTSNHADAAVESHLKRITKLKNIRTAPNSIVLSWRTSGVERKELLVRSSKATLVLMNPNPSASARPRRPLSYVLSPL